MAKWNGYSIANANDESPKSHIFHFECAYCDFKMLNQPFATTNELKTLRTQWRDHVDAYHGGPYLGAKTT